MYRFQTFYVDKAKSINVELEAFVQFTDHPLGTLGVTFTEANYPDDCARLDSTDPNFSANAANLCGNPLTNAPDWVVILGSTYERPLFQGAVDFFLIGSVRYETERRTTTQPTEILRPDLSLPGDFQGVNTKVNLRMGLGYENERWAAELWGKMSLTSVPRTSPSTYRFVAVSQIVHVANSSKSRVLTESHSELGSRAGFLKKRARRRLTPSWTGTDRNRLPVPLHGQGRT